jgi:alkanesulfonate monooxygenase SsuD/methylene tetrahydromethanopterin reductase-like flavin-dependent oxidoreductase (luciferase family)
MDFSTVQFGVYVNNRAAVFLGAEYGMQAMLGLARQAEAAGFDFVSVGDSVLAKPRYAPIVTLAAIAGVTRRIRLTTGILQPHLHHIVPLAQEWATLDVASEGRTSMGVGLGTGRRDLVDAELALVGLTRKNRARAFEEAIVLLKRLWAGGPTTFEGRIYRLTEVDIGYRPAQIPGPAIVIACGGYVPRTPGSGPNDFGTEQSAGTFTGPAERVGRLGDGWITGMATPAEWRAMWARIVAAAREAGRDVEQAGFERRINCFVHVDDDPAKARAEGKAFLESYNRLPMDEETVDRFLVSGPRAKCAERLQAWIDAGANSFQMVLASARQQEQLDRVAEMRSLVQSRRQPTHARAS